MEYSPLVGNDRTCTSPGTGWGGSFAGGSMRTVSTLRLRATVLTAAALVLPTMALSPDTAWANPHRGDRTDPAQARRVDRVPTPDLAWFDCSQLAPGAWCATADLPLDYDEPDDATTQVAVLKIKAADQEHKLGTLFLNPGGPGGSGTYMAAMAREFLSPALLDRFDIVGFDPRGTNFSTNVACWASGGEQLAAIGPMLSTHFPWTGAEESAHVAASKAFGRACSSTGRPLSASMSTAEVARDMDVLRRAVGDRQLTYLGFSYGSYLGDVYANLFPDRVRALVIDGVIDADGWAGTRRTARVPQTTRIRSGEATARAMDELLQRCEAAGAHQCEFADRGDPRANYDMIMSSLQKQPLVWEDPEDSAQTLTYATLTQVLLGNLYAPTPGEPIAAILSFVYDLLLPTADPGTPEAARQESARRNLKKALAPRSTSAARARAFRASGRAVFPLSFPYDNSLDAFQSVLCTDGLNPRHAAAWPRYADAADRRAPHFGRAWTWRSSACASRTWTARDEDAHRGPFTRRTTNPVLVVGNLWDPATNYDSAAKVARQLPGARLLSSDNWGHTAYGTSTCATGAIDAYLLTRTLPAAGTMCEAAQPYTRPGGTGAGAAGRQLPPVVPPFPGAEPR